jgi:hypothetical protein
MHQVSYSPFQGVFFYKLNSKAQTCLTHIKCTLSVLEVPRQQQKIFSQNVRGFRKKRAELIKSFEIDHKICSNFVHAERLMSSVSNSVYLLSTVKM